MGLFDPFSVPSSRSDRDRKALDAVGNSYDKLLVGARPGFEGTSRDMLAAARGQVGPGNEFDPAVARLLGYATSPVNNDLEDYFRQKYMADVNNRLAARGLVGQGVGEGLANDAERSYAAGRADTALDRILAATGGASATRSGQANRAATLTSAGLAPYDVMNRMLAGETGAYGSAGTLANQGAAIQSRANEGAFNLLNPYGNGLKMLGGGLQGGYQQLFGGGGSGGSGFGSSGGGDAVSSAEILRGGGDSGLQVTGGDFLAEGGRVGGRGAYDHIQAVLTPQEFVVRRPVAVKTRPALEALNSGDVQGAARKLARIGSLAR